jgi:hypothetical protein
MLVGKTEGPTATPSTTTANQIPSTWADSRAAGTIRLNTADGRVHRSEVP